MSDYKTVHFDHNSIDYKENWETILRDLRHESPVAWSEAHGGFWVFTKHADVKRVFRETKLFTVAHTRPEGSYSGVTIPPWPDTMIPMELDGPEHIAYRRFLQPWFVRTPERMAELDAKLTRWVTYCLDKKIESGTIDFADDLANPVPALFTLDLLGLPLEEWEFYAPPFHGMVSYNQGTPEFDQVMADYAAVTERLAEVIAERRKNPRDDFMSQVLGLRPLDQAMTEDQTLQLVNLLLLGGVETTTNLVSWAIDFLDKNHDVRQQLVDNPSLLPAACEEFLRLSSPGQIHVRTAAADTEVRGVKISEGDRVLISYASGNRDEEVFDDADQFRLDRGANDHLAFGMGGHKCIGADQARAEFRVMMREILARMPDYKLIDGAERYPSFGAMQGWVKLPAAFTPGPVVGATLY